MVQRQPMTSSSSMSIRSEFSLGIATEPDVQRIVERLFLIEVVSFDWNCPKYITPRYTADEIQQVIAPLKERIAELEAQLKKSKLT